jgi:PLP dependent protein
LLWQQSHKKLMLTVSDLLYLARSYVISWVNAMSLTLSQYYAELQHKIRETCEKTGRNPANVALIGVGKGHERRLMQEAVSLGLTHFGENRVQEAGVKFCENNARLPEFRTCTLHLIGPLQSNKVKTAVGLFDVIHTVDRASLVRELAKARAHSQAFPRLLVQVNIGREPQKAGVLPEGLSALLQLCAENTLSITGLMCIPPAEQPPETYFTQLATLAQKHDLPELSMGMSGDFEAAITAGATYIRVGSALFGARAKAVP